MIQEEVYNDALKILRDIYGQKNDSCNVSNQIVDIFKKHNIFELCSLINDKYSNLKLNALIKCNKNKAYYDFIFSELKEIFDKIKEIPYSVLKGIVTAYHAYANIGLRGTSDIDILVSRRNIEKVSKILLENGFVQGFVNKDNILCEYDREQKLFFLTQTHQTAPFIKKTKNKLFPYISIDLNFNILWGETSINIEIDEFLEDCKFISHGLTRFKSLSIEKQLIHTCLHNYKENNSIYLLTDESSINLRKYCDIYGLILNPQFNFRLFSILVEKYMIQEYIYYSLFYACFVFDDLNRIRQFEKWRNTDVLERYGLTEKEYKLWDMNFFERLFNLTSAEFFKSLNENDKRKILVNNYFMKGNLTVNRKL